MLDNSSKIVWSKVGFELGTFWKSLETVWTKFETCLEKAWKSLETVWKSLDFGKVSKTCGKPWKKFGFVGKSLEQFGTSLEFSSGNRLNPMRLGQSLGLVKL